MSHHDMSIERLFSGPEDEPTRDCAHLAAALQAVELLAAVQHKQRMGVRCHNPLACRVLHVSTMSPAFAAFDQEEVLLAVWCHVYMCAAA